MKHDALAAARAAVPVITRLRQETEAQRRLATPIVEDLRKSHLCRLALVAELHGLELPAADTLDVYETLARCEAAASWIVWNNALPCFFSRYLEPAVRAAVFGDESSLYASSTRPTGRAAIDGDGFRVSGRWSLVSGCELAEWLLLACIVERDGEPVRMESGAPQLRLAYVPRRDVTILDTWNAGGLRGTGSHDVVVENAPVPLGFTVAPGDPCTLDCPHGRLPIICTMAAGFGAQAIGVGQGAVDTLVELTRTKLPADPGPALADRPALLAALSRHTAALAAARLYLHSAVEDLWDTACDDRVTADHIGTVWGAALHAVDAGRHAVDEMYAAGGATSLYVDCPLEREHRDIHAMLQHVVAQPFWIEDAARVRLGGKAIHPLFAV